MKPLLAVICYNRREEARSTLLALKETGTFEEAQVVVFDNGSTDGTVETLHDLCRQGVVEADDLFLSDTNLGCPSAMNLVVARFRKPGQHFIKVDPDVVLCTPGWVGKLVAFLNSHPDVMMASPWYSELDEPHCRSRERARHEGWIEAYPIPGHCTIHRGSLLDRAGFFDVLSLDHLYGFEDNLMCYRVIALEGRCAIVAGIELRNIQRKNSLDMARAAGVDVEGRDDHVKRLRPLYEKRIALIRRFRQKYHVDESGRVEVEL